MLIWSQSRWSFTGLLTIRDKSNGCYGSGDVGAAGGGPGNKVTEEGSTMECFRGLVPIKEPSKSFNATLEVLKGDS